MIRNKKFFLLLLTAYCLLLTITNVFAKNKVISKSFNWQIFQTEHFDVYFYDEGKNILPEFADLIEKIYREYTAFYDIVIDEKIPIFLYIGHNDFEQTNVTDVGEGTGGVTEAFKNRVVVPHLGSKHWLEYVTRHELVHAIQFEILFSGFWKSARLLKFYILPLWLMEGLAEYGTKELAFTEREMYLRDAATSNRIIPVMHLFNFGHLKPHQVTLAYKESQELIRFIAEEYGEDKIVRMLKLYREKFDPNSILLETIGLTTDLLDKKFQEYLQEKYEFYHELGSMGDFSRHLKEPDEYGKRITNLEVYNQFNTNPVFVDGDKKIAYITDRNGFNEIVLQSLFLSGERKSNQKESRTISQERILVGQKDFDLVENISRQGKGLSVSKSGGYEQERSKTQWLVFVGEKEQKDYIYLYDIKSSKLKRLETGFEIISSADISSDGKKIVFVAMQGGYNNIYLCDLEGKNIVKLTESFDDVSDAVFSPDGTFIVFAKEEKVKSDDRPYQRNLYVLDIKDVAYGSVSTPIQLTDFQYDEFSPAVSSDNETVVFVADKDGIYDLYSINIKSKETKKLTNVVGGNFTPAFSSDSKLLAFSSYRKGEKHIYIAEMNQLENNQIFYTKLPIEETLLEKQKSDRFSLRFRPYRFYPSTDLFFPLLYYSNIGGLFTAFYWQISEMLGDHQAAVSLLYGSADESLNYGVNYTFAKFRPKLFLRLSGKGGYIDWYEKIHRTVHTQIAGVSYPASRFNAVSFAVKNGLETTLDKSNSELVKTTSYRDHAALISFIRNTSEGKYIETTRGSRFKLSQEFGTDIFGGDYIYQNTSFELHKFFPLGKEHLIGNRLLGVTSAGRDRRSFRLFGFDRVRTSNTYKTGKYIEPYKGSNIIISNLEYRFPIVNDINYHMWYLFPDFFFKSFYGIAFLDVGTAWYDIDPMAKDIVYCYGLGLKFDTFILQLFYLPLNFYLSYSPVNDKYEFSFTLGSMF